jgi:lysyl-tRNA synthetase class 2
MEQQQRPEYEVRLEKFAGIAAREVVFKDKFERTHTIKQARELEDEVQASLCGRITALRWFGKLVFGRLYDVEGEIQFSISKNDLGDDDFAFFKESVDVGDYIGVTGVMYHTQKGEFTIKASNVVILSKSLRPLPEKFHGITDVDKKFRQRYLDVITSEETRRTLSMRIQMLRFLREYLQNADFLEVETPILQNVASGAAARPFITRHNTLDLELHLRIAPELYLKQIIACGFDRVFELGKNFRNEGMDAMHLQEFTMLEWYASYWDFNDNIEFVCKMMQELLLNLRGSLQIEYQGQALDFSSFARLDYLAAINEILGANVFDFADTDALKAHMLAQASLPADEIKAAKSIPALVDLLFKRKLRNGIIQPTIVYNYPAFMVPLARRNDADPRTIDMFQVIFVGAEIVKAYSELVDPFVQRAAFEEQAQNKAAGDDESFEMDEAFLLAMEHGMPPMSGLGFGIDRFMSIIADQPTLRDVIFFPMMK